MIFNRTSISPEAVAETVRSLLNHQPKRMYLATAYCRSHMSPWQFATGRLAPASEGCADRDEIYTDHAFISRVIPEFSVDEFMRHLTSEGYMVADGLQPIKRTEGTSFQWNEYLRPSHVTGNVPIRSFSTALMPSIGMSEAPLAGFDLPFHRSATSYLRKFTGIKSFKHGGPSSTGYLWIELPDMRGRIELSGGYAFIKSACERLCITGRINDGDSVILKDDNRASVDPELLTSIDLWLLTEKNEVVDYCSSRDGQYPYPTRKTERDYDEQLKAMITGGENETCEFKEYIDLTATKDKKAREIEETVCAFSNQSGGTLFVGVTNKGVVIGLYNQVRAAYRQLAGDPIEHYRDAIRTRLQENLKNSGCFRIDARTIHTELVVVVTVDRLESLNYLLNPCEAYIRSGATSMKMPLDKVEDKVRARLTGPTFGDFLPLAPLDD